MSRVARWLGSSTGLLAVIAAAKLLLHLATASRYGYFGDELYFLACGEHLDWGYVDQPPLIAAVAWLLQHTIGTSLLAMRLPSALAGAALVVLTGLLARELGGGRVAVALGAIASALGGVYLVIHYLFTMNAYEPLFWTGCAYVVARIVRTGDERLWLAFGALAGLGLENKYSTAIFAGALVLGVLLSPGRRALGRRHIWLGGALALLLFLPNLVWNVRHGWPFFELMRNIRMSGRDVALAPLEFLGHQVLNMNPASLPLALAGLGWLFLSTSGRRFRPLGVGVAATLAFFILTRGKDYYFAPAFATLFAAGGVALEAFTEHAWRWLRTVLFALPVLTLPILPLLLPILSPEGLISYQERLGLALPATEKAHARAALPHHFAFQFGWEEMVAAVAAAYRALPAEEQSRVAVIGSNYAESGAVDLLGPRHGLPLKALGVHQSYWLWGPGDPTKDVFILLGRTKKGVEDFCGDVEVVAELNHPWAAVWERKPVLVCRKPKAPLRDVWPRVKSWG
jgi:4-amino-4-deoxy-L-arabinose transferase-like glycosyltransferase